MRERTGKSTPPSIGMRIPSGGSVPVHLKKCRRHGGHLSNRFLEICPQHRCIQKRNARKGLAYPRHNKRLPRFAQEPFSIQNGPLGDILSLPDNPEKEHREVLEAVLSCPCNTGVSSISTTMRDIRQSKSAKSKRT